MYDAELDVSSLEKGRAANLRLLHREKTQSIVLPLMDDIVNSVCVQYLDSYTLDLYLPTFAPNSTRSHEDNESIAKFEYSS